MTIRLVSKSKRKQRENNMAMKKSTKPARPGGSTPPDTRSLQVSSGVTVLGSMPWKTNLPHLKRDPLSAKQLAELKKIIAKNEADNKAVAKSSKKDAKIVKSQNKKPLVTGRGATKPVTALTVGNKKKPVIKVTPRGGRGGGGMLGGIFGTKNR
jgi:hypothetical protein